MSEEHVVAFTVTEEEQRRLALLHRHAPHFGKNSISLIEDIMARKAWDALPKDAPS